MALHRVCLEPLPGWFDPHWQALGFIAVLPGMARWRIVDAPLYAWSRSLVCWKSRKHVRGQKFRFEAPTLSARTAKKHQSLDLQDRQRNELALSLPVYGWIVVNPAEESGWGSQFAWYRNYENEAKIGRSSFEGQVAHLLSCVEGISWPGFENRLD